MSPASPRALTKSTGFPRVSGDEPSSYPQALTQNLFSPRERG